MRTARLEMGRGSRIHHQFQPLAEIEFCIKIREMEKRLFDPLIAGALRLISGSQLGRDMLDHLAHR